MLTFPAWGAPIGVAPFAPAAGIAAPFGDARLPETPLRVGWAV
jgi:hypothetical protein